MTYSGFPHFRGGEYDDLMRTLLKRKEPKTGCIHTLGIQIGEINCSLRCSDTEIYEKLYTVYQNYLTEEPADITVELELTDNLSVEKIESILTRSRYMHQGKHFRSSGKLVKGKYDMESNTVNITGERNLVNPDNIKLNLLNQLIAMAYYTGCKMKYNGSPPPAMLVVIM